MVVVVVEEEELFFHWHLFFYFISNNNCRLLTLNIVSFIFFHYRESKPMIRKLKVIVYFRNFFFLSKFKYFCFVTILDMSSISRSYTNDHIIFNVGTPSLEARNIRLVNKITYIIEESKLISENISPNVIHC